MIEVWPRLFVGGAGDYESVMRRPQAEWAVLTCAKEPWHREALGYTGRGAPKTHPDYFWAYRDNRLILNMVDAPQPFFFNPVMVAEGLKFIDENHTAGKKVLVHCNQGNSRAPGMALMYLVYKGFIDQSYEPAVEHFSSIYPAFAPGMGIELYMKEAFKGYGHRHEAPVNQQVAS